MRILTGTNLTLIASLLLVTQLADAQMRGVRRRTRRRTAVIVSEQNKQQQQQQQAQQQAAQQSGSPQSTDAAAGATPSGVSSPTNPVVIDELPGSCESQTVSGESYERCGDTYYQPAFSENRLVYVEATPPEADSAK